MATDNIAKFREFFTTEQKRKSGCGSKHNFKLEIDIITSDILANSWLN